MEIMLKPSDIDPNKPMINTKRVADLEEQFDTAIRQAQNRGTWPAKVSNELDSTTPAEIEFVAEKYRVEGWKVVTGNPTERALIDHPDRTR